MRWEDAEWAAEAEARLAANEPKLAKVRDQLAPIAERRKAEIDRHRAAILKLTDEAARIQQKAAPLFTPLPLPDYEQIDAAVAVSFRGTGSAVY